MSPGDTTHRFTAWQNTVLCCKLKVCFSYVVTEKPKEGGAETWKMMVTAQQKRLDAQDKELIDSCAKGAELECQVDILYVKN